METQTIPVKPPSSCSFLRLAPAPDVSTWGCFFPSPLQGNLVSVLLLDLVMSKKGCVKSMQSLENHWDKAIYLLMANLHRNWLSTSPSGSLMIPLTIKIVNVRGIYICRMKWPYLRAKSWPQARQWQLYHLFQWRQDYTCSFVKNLSLTLLFLKCHWIFNYSKCESFHHIIKKEGKMSLCWEFC